MSAIHEETALLCTQATKLRKQLAAETAKAEKIRNATARAEAEAAPKADPTAQAQVVEQLRRRNVQLKGLLSKVGQDGSGALAAVATDQDGSAKLALELRGLRASVDAATAEMQKLTKQIEHTRKIIEMEKAAGKHRHGQATTRAAARHRACPVRLASLPLHALSSSAPTGAHDPWGARPIVHAQAR